MAPKKTAPKAEEPLKEEVALKPEKEAAIPAEVDNLLRLYPQYERLWVTKDGFVHPENASKACIGDATLYQNKYYKQYND